MDCKQCEALLDQRQKETLDHEERREMQAHLDTCQACQMRLAVLESFSTLDEGDEVPISFSQGWRQKIQAEGVQKKKVTLAKASRWLAVAAALVLVVGGTFITGQNRDLLFDDKGVPNARTEKILRSTPMGRFGEPEELIGTLLFLVSPEASGFVTGVVIPVDGGFNVYSGV